MKPMLARTYGPKYRTFPCYLQPKLNGIRALYQSGQFQSRDELFWNPAVLHHLTRELESQTWRPIFRDFILDGELYVHGWRLQRINSAVAIKRSLPTPDTLHVEYHIFDCIDRRTGFSEPFSSRFAKIFVPTLNHESRIRFVPTHHIYLREEVDLYFRHYAGHGFEGVMLRPDGTYDVGEHLSSRTGNHTQVRSHNLWKHKSWQDAEFTCIGITHGDGKCSGGIGALILQTVSGDTFNVGTGYTDEERIAFLNDPPIGRQIKVRYLELSADGIPLTPSFLCVM